MLLLVVEVKKLVYTPYARVLLQKNMDMLIACKFQVYGHAYSLQAIMRDVYTILY